MLHNFVVKNRQAILALSQEKAALLAVKLAGSEQLNEGAPLFLDQLVQVLENKLQKSPSEAMLADAAAHGKEFLRLGYSLSHVVHSYGAMCQAITECAVRMDAQITSEEFNLLNGCLDIAIAAAVSEYHFRSNEMSEEREIQHLGFLAHELRNALSSAMVAHEMIKAGMVGTGGSTAAVLESNLARMRHLIDRSLSEVRLRSDADLYIETYRLCDIFDQVGITAKSDADRKKQILDFTLDRKIVLSGDRQFLVSAIAKLVQNGIKYTRLGGTIHLRAFLKEGRLRLEIEDQCGGIPPGRAEELFTPYFQASSTRGGLGLGLSITRRAVELSQGTINLVNKPGSGCMFVIDIPQHAAVTPSAKVAVPGVLSVQPDFSKKKKD